MVEQVAGGCWMGHPSTIPLHSTPCRLMQVVASVVQVGCEGGRGLAMSSLLGLASVSLLDLGAVSRTLGWARQMGLEGGRYLDA